MFSDLKDIKTSLCLLPANRIQHKPVLALLMLFLSVSCQINKTKEATVLKSNPGHYVAVGPHFDLAEINHFDQAALKGVNKRYFWKTLEPAKGEYDFSQIEADLTYCAEHNKQLIVFLVDRSFWIRSALPTYLSTHEWTNNGKTFVPARWRPEFQERFIALGENIAKRFNNHPNFEGIALQETSLGMPDDVLQEYGYTPKKYKAALLSYLKTFESSFANSNVFWYQNGIQGNNQLIREIADSIAYSKNIIMGGPDILPYRRWLRNTYKIYPDYQDKLRLFCSAQDDSYHHHKNDIRGGQANEVPQEGYLSMEEIFLFARDTMHVQYLFWNYYYEGEEKEGWSFDDAIEVVREYPTFNDHKP